MVVALAVAAITVVMALIAPLRPISGDTLPTRYGGLVLACTGSFDLGRVDWIADSPTPYWARTTRDELISVYGPAPAVVAAVAFVGVDAVTREAVQRRGRIVAAGLVALAAALLALALRRGWFALIAALSFAGAATLGQALWQQSVSLPLVVGALAALAGRERRPRVAWCVPAVLTAAVSIRPAIAPLCFGIGLAWLVAHRDRKAILYAAIAAVAVAVPFLVWNAIHLGTPLPTAQLDANAAVSADVFALRGLPVGLAGLVAAPGRGLLWYAPIVLVAVVAAARTRDATARLVALGIIAQLLVMACFHMWWGGVCFGPRFLAETVWVAVWLATLAPSPRWLVATASTVTVGVGLLGLLLWRGEQWEARRMPDIDQSALWDVADSPLTALGRDIASEPLALESLVEPARMRCTGRRIVSESGP